MAIKKATITEWFTSHLHTGRNRKVPRAGWNEHRCHAVLGGGGLHRPPPRKVPTSESLVKEVLAWDAASPLGGHVSSEFSQGQGHPRLGEGTADAHPGDDLASGKKPDETYSWVDGDKHQGR